MDTIKKYFNSSTVDNVDQSLNENDRLNVTSNISNDTIHNNDEITQRHFESDPAGVEVNHFIRKIQNLEEENDRLTSIIGNKNVIIKDCSKPNRNYVPDITTKKILQLTERVQDLMSELQTIKSCTSGDNEKKRDCMEIKQLTDKLNLSNKKICNYRNHIMQLKNDLQVTQNALSNEIGDPELMQAVLSGTGSSNSRGRAQQILVLQQRVNELQAKENYSKNKDIHKKNVSIRQMEKVRKAITDQALNDANSKISELKRSLNVWKSRSKALDVEITVLRVQIQKLLSKSKDDNETIDKLKAESSNNNNNNIIQQFKTNETIRLLRSITEKVEKTNEQQISDLNNRELKIAQLESTIQNYNKTIENKDMCTMDFSDPKDIFISKLNGFEHHQLVNLLCIAHNKICEQIKIIVDFKNKFKTEKQKLQKVESKIGLFGSSTLTKQRSNSALYQLKHEKNPNEKLTELQNKLELTEEECAALKERLDTLSMVNKENVQMFAKAINDMKQQFINFIKC